VKFYFVAGRRSKKKRKAFFESYFFAKKEELKLKEFIRRFSIINSLKII
jgi:hypothetical protein